MRAVQNSLSEGSSGLSTPAPSWLDVEKSGVLDNAPSLSKTPLPELRKLQGGFGIKSNNVPTALATKDITIPVSNGSIAVRVYTPSANPGALPLCVVYHGGGWTIGDLDTEDGISPHGKLISVLPIHLRPRSCNRRERRLSTVRLCSSF